MNRLQNVIKGMTFSTLFALLALSCSNDSETNNNNSGEELTQAELKTVLATDEITGVADMALAEIYSGDSRNAKSYSAKLSNECYEAAYTETGFTAVFNNCVLNGTDNVNGTLNVAYEQGSQNASFTATFTDFYVGQVKVNGTRTYSVSANVEESSIEFSVTSDIELILADESTIEEIGTKTLLFTFGETLETTTIAISGSWTLEVDGNTYVVEVTEDLIANLSCAKLVSGLLYVGKNGLAVTIDFGDGSCDNQAEIIYPDETREEFVLED